jgi:hypothetical protein
VRSIFLAPPQPLIIPPLKTSNQRFPSISSSPLKLCQLTCPWITHLEEILPGSQRLMRAINSEGLAARVPDAILTLEHGSLNGLVTFETA